MIFGIKLPWSPLTHPECSFSRVCNPRRWWSCRHRSKYQPRSSEHTTRYLVQIPPTQEIPGQGRSSDTMTSLPAFNVCALVSEWPLKMACHCIGRTQSTCRPWCAPTILLVATRCGNADSSLDVKRCDVGLLSCFVFDMGWRLQDKHLRLSAPQSSCL